MDGPTDLDAVMESINLLIEDMEDNLKMTKVSLHTFMKFVEISTF